MINSEHIVIAQSSVPAPVVAFKGRLESSLIFPLGTLFALIALAFFIWGLSKYFFSEDEEALKRAKTIMLWGTLGLFVIISVGSIIRLLQCGIIPGSVCV